MKKNERNNSLVVQAGILAGAGILVRIIGLLYNTPLVHIIGDEGFGYYDSAYVAYSIVLLISSYSIPSAVSKIIAQKLAQKEYKNAFRIFKCTLIYVAIVGLFAALFLFFGAGLLVSMESAVLPLKILAPTVFFSGILGAFRGFFQAQRTMVQTSISQIIEQIFNAGFSIWMAYILVNAAEGLGTSKRASYGAAGSTIGTGVGVLSALAFMLFVYFLNRKKFMAKIENDPTPKVDSYKSIFRLILAVVTPFIISTGIYNLNGFLDKTLYQIMQMDFHLLPESDVAFELSAFAKANKISNIPIAIAAAMASTLIPRLSSKIALGQIKETKDEIAKATKVTMFVAIPATVGLAVLAKPIMMVIFNQPESLDMASLLMIILSATVVFYGLSTMTQAVLQATGHMNIPIVNALVALILHSVIMVLFIRILPKEAAIYVYGFSTILYSVILCILNGISVKRRLGYNQEFDKTFLRPFISAVIMGGLVFGVYHGIYAIMEANLLALIIAMILGVILYFVLCIKWQALDEEEIRSLPKGATLVKISKKVKLL